MADPEANEPDESGPEEHGEMDNTFFVPADAVSGHDCKPGDILKFKVVGKDADGDIEVAIEGYDEGSGENSDEADRAELRKVFAGPVSGMKG